MTYVAQSLGQASSTASLSASAFVSANWKWLLGGLGLLLVLRSARVLNRGGRSRKRKAKRRNPFVLRKMPENVRVGEAHSLSGARALAKGKGKYIVVEETSWRRLLADEFSRNPFTVYWFRSGQKPLPLGTRDTKKEADQQKRNLVSLAGYSDKELDVNYETNSRGTR